MSGKTCKMCFVVKTIALFLKEQINSTAGPLKVCVGYSVGAGAAIHSMSQVFRDEGETAETLLIDVTNTLNQMNRAPAMHNIQITCPIMSKYVINTFQSLAKLFVCGSGEILSQEGTAQGR